MDLSNRPNRNIISPITFIAPSGENHARMARSATTTTASSPILMAFCEVESLAEMAAILPSLGRYCVQRRALFPDRDRWRRALQSRDGHVFRYSRHDDTAFGSAHDPLLRRISQAPRKNTSCMCAIGLQSSFHLPLYSRNGCFNAN